MSIRKRVWKTAKGETKEAWVFDYTDQTGNRHLKTFARKKDAEGYRITTDFQVSQGTHTADSQSITVADAAKAWLSSCESHQLEASTLAAYRQHVDLHIGPFLGRDKLSQLTSPIIREFEDRLRRGDPAPGEKHGHVRSPAMVRKIVGSLGSLLADAQERGNVARNVVRDLRSRRKRGKERSADRRQRGKLKIGVDIPSPEEIRAIVEALDGRSRPFIVTAIFTGLRASELRGLRWKDIDLRKNELHVRQRADRYNAIGAPKSEAGHRTVPFPPVVARTLKEWKLACPNNERDLAFPSSTGAIEHHKNIIKRALVPAQIRAGVTAPGKDGPRAKYTGLHALRHFYASWCINRRIDGGLELPAKAVQERLGHSSIVMTMDVYGHLFPSREDASDLADAERALLG
jgi:integrase